MVKHSGFIALIFSLCLAHEMGSAYAYTTEKGKISASAGALLNQSVNIATKSNESGAVPEFGSGGVIVSAGVEENLEVEVGFFPMQNLYYWEKADSYLLEKVLRLHVASGVRYWLKPYLAPGIMFFSSYQMGDPRIIDSRGDFSETSARDTTEYGFEASLQLELWRRNIDAVILDLRRTHSVTAKENETNDFWFLYAGIKRTLP